MTPTRPPSTIDGCEPKPMEEAVKKSNPEAALDELAAAFRANAETFVPREIGLATIAALKAGNPVSADTLLQEFEARLAVMIDAGKPAMNLGRIEVEEVIAALRSLRPT